MSEDRLDRIVALLELLCKLGGANPHQIRHAGEVRAPEPAPEAARPAVSVIPHDARGRGARLVPHGNTHPHEKFDGDYPTSTVRSRDEFFKRRD